MAETFKCKNCGGELLFSPGSQSLACPYCGTENENPDTIPEMHEELDFRAALADFRAVQEVEEVQIESCRACGAEVTLPPNVTSGECDFCGTPLTAGGKAHKAMKPQYLLPFEIDKGEAKKLFRNWIVKRRFAPGKLKKQARMSEPLKGIYYPYWTFDSQTFSEYRGERGEHYTETVQRTDSEGKTVTEQVTKTRWYPAAGRVQRFFDDILIPASRTLKTKLANKLQNWDLSKLRGFAEQYLSGFKAESYSVGLEDGFGIAKDEMNAAIRQDIRRDIGGDEQRIHQVNTRYEEIKFKYILLPIWAMAYKFKDKYYQVLINASTGEVAGERPFSVAKIIALILAIAAIGGAAYFVYYLVSQG